MVQAGVYSSLIHYLKALEALGGNPHDGRAVVAKMKEMPTDDDLFGKGSIRADGRKIHPAYLFEVKYLRNSKLPGTTTSWSPPSRRKKPLFRWRRACVRW